MLAEERISTPLFQGKVIRRRNQYTIICVRVDNQELYTCAHKINTAIS